MADTEEVLRDVLEALAEEIEKLYHRAEREFDLPTEPSAYAANAKDGKRWSSPYHPAEIAQFVRSKIDGIVEVVLKGN